MLVVTWEVQGAERIFRLKDYIVSPATLFKLKNIARALGESRDFEAGCFDLEQHKNKIVNLRLAVQSSDQYGDRNNVVEYKEGKFEPQEPTRVRDPESEIPF